MIWKFSSYISLQLWDLAILGELIRPEPRHSHLYTEYRYPQSADLSGGPSDTLNTGCNMQFSVDYSSFRRMFSASTSSRYSSYSKRVVAFLALVQTKQATNPPFSEKLNSRGHMATKIEKRGEGDSVRALWVRSTLDGHSPADVIREQLSPSRGWLLTRPPCFVIKCLSSRSVGVTGEGRALGHAAL